MPNMAVKIVTMKARTFSVFFILLPLYLGLFLLFEFDKDDKFGLLSMFEILFSYSFGCLKSTN